MPRPRHLRTVILLLALTLCCLLPVRAFFLAPSSPQQSSSSSCRSSASSSAVAAAITGTSTSSSSSSSSLSSIRPLLLRLHSTPSPDSEPDEQNKRSKRRRRKAGNGPSSSSSSSSIKSSTASSPPLAGPGTARYDSTLEELIVDERKSALPRLEDLKILKSGKTVAADSGKTGGKPGILMPRELEEMKQREKAKEATKGAPPYFDTMTKITWGAIAFMVVTEVVVAFIPKASTIPTP